MYFHWFIYKDKEMNPSSDAWEERINKIIRKISKFNEEVSCHQLDINFKIDSMKSELQTEMRALHNAVSILVENHRRDAEAREAESLMTLSKSGSQAVTSGFNKVREVSRLSYLSCSSSPQQKQQKKDKKKKKR